MTASSTAHQRVLNTRRSYLAQQTRFFQGLSVNVEARANAERILRLEGGYSDSLMLMLVRQARREAEASA